jgi:hypothetical protein
LPQNELLPSQILHLTLRVRRTKLRVNSQIVFAVGAIRKRQSLNPERTD